MQIKAPFPWFGGKSKVASEVWEALREDVFNYVEPFAGSLAVLLGRPNWEKHNIIETVNDKDAYISNFWRSISFDPEQTAAYADNPVNENDLHARHIWLKERRESLRQRIEGDPDYYDAKIAGWWVWGQCCWIGGGWCTSNGPWGIVTDDEGLRQLVHLGSAGQGVTRQLVHLGSAGQGVTRKLVHLLEWFHLLSSRLCKVRVASGDWKRVITPSVTSKIGITGVFLDPPYSSTTGRDMSCYGDMDDGSISRDVNHWCLENGSNPLLRIVLAGYEGEHNNLEEIGWSKKAWKAGGGFSNQRKLKNNTNNEKERLWMSPYCLQKEQFIQINLSNREG